MCPARVCLLFAAVAMFHAAAPSVAFGQWYFGGYLGGNHTQDTTVAVRLQSDNIALKFHDVQFA